MYLLQNRSRISSFLLGEKPLLVPGNDSTAIGTATPVIAPVPVTVASPESIQSSPSSHCKKSPCCSHGENNESKEETIDDEASRVMRQMIKDQEEAYQNFQKDKLRKRGGTPAPSIKK